MAIEEFINQILFLGVVHGFVVNLISIFTGKVKIKAYLFLNAIVFFLSLNNLQAWLAEKSFSFNNYYLDNLHSPWYIFLPPSIYLFITEYIRDKKKKLIIFIVVGFFILSTCIKLYFLFQNDGISTDLFSNRISLFNNYEESFGFIITIIVFIYSYYILHKSENKKFINSFDNLNWIKYFFIFSTFALIIWFSAILSNIYQSSSSTNIYTLLRLTTSVLIYWIAYKGMYKQKIFMERNAIRSKIKKHSVSTHKNYENQIKNGKDESLFKNIEDHIVKNQSFTNPLLSVESLANELKIGQHRLSHTINIFSKTNFSDYINRFRVKRAKELLKDETYLNYTILSIGLESGFNSKSVFYTEFKKYTDKTPKQFR